MKAILDIIIAVTLAALGQIFWKLGMKSIGIINKYDFNTIAGIFKNLQVEIGVLLYALSTVFWLIALSKKELSYVYPFIAGTYIIVLALSHIIIGEQFGVYRLVGASIVLVGLMLIIKGG